MIDLACLDMPGLQCFVPGILFPSPFGARSDHGVFGLFSFQDQVKQRLCLRLRTEASDLVSATAELSKETLQQVRGADQSLAGERHPQIVERQVKIVREAAHGLGFERSPLLLKVRQAMGNNLEVRAGVNGCCILQDGLRPRLLGLLDGLTARQI